MFDIEQAQIGHTESKEIKVLAYPRDGGGRGILGNSYLFKAQCFGSGSRNYIASLIPIMHSKCGSHTVYSLHICLFLQCTYLVSFFLFLHIHLFSLFLHIHLFSLSFWISISVLSLSPHYLFSLSFSIIISFLFLSGYPSQFSLFLHIISFLYLSP